MQAEHEYLVGNTASKELVMASSSSYKEYALFKDAYHELQKEPMKVDVIARALSFIAKVEVSAKPFGVLTVSKLRHGSMRIRKSNRRRFLLGLLAYLAIGIFVMKKFFPAWKYNPVRVILLWPLLLLFRIAIGKLPW